MTIALDIDNTINNLAEAILSVYNEDYNDSLKLDDITDYYIERFVKPEAKKDFWKLFVEKETWKRIKPINVKAVQWLIDNHTVYFVTATEPCNLEKKQNWLGRNFKNIDIRKRLVRCYDKGLINADILIDDCTKNLKEFKGIGVCINYPWNQDWDGIRVDNIETFINEFILNGRIEDYRRMCDEYPVKTYFDDFKEKFPNMQDDPVECCLCRCKLYGGWEKDTSPICCPKGISTCDECWHKSIE